MENKRLIYRNGIWAVCEPEEVDVEDGRELAWRYAGGYFCLVGKEDYAWPLPYPEERNFHNDRFTFAVDRRHTWVEQWEKVGGSDNMSAARAAFDRMVEISNSNTIVRLRHGGRIITEKAGSAS